MDTNANREMAMKLLFFVLIAIKSPLALKTLLVLLTFTFLLLIITFDFTCHCPDQRKVIAPLYAVVAATSFCVNLIPVVRRRLPQSIQMDFLKWHLILITEASEVLKAVQNMRNEAVFFINILAGIVAGVATFLAGASWLRIESNASEYTWILISLWVIAVVSLLLTAFVRYAEERQQQEETHSRDKDP